MQALSSALGIALTASSSANGALDPKSTPNSQEQKGQIHKWKVFWDQSQASFGVHLLTPWGSSPAKHWASFFLEGVGRRCWQSYQRGLSGQRASRSNPSTGFSSRVVSGLLLKSSDFQFL